MSVSTQLALMLVLAFIVFLVTLGVVQTLPAAA